MGNSSSQENESGSTNNSNESSNNSNSNDSNVDRSAWGGNYADQDQLIRSGDLNQNGH